jgi:hypothetical protein
VLATQHLFEIAACWWFCGCAFAVSLVPVIPELAAMAQGPYKAVIYPRVPVRAIQV